MGASTLNDLAALIWQMTLAARIREAMGEMSPAAFARATKVSSAAVTFWLDGTTKSLKAEKAWICMPFAIFGTKPILLDILQELRVQNQLLLQQTRAKPAEVPPSLHSGSLIEAGKA